MEILKILLSGSAGCHGHVGQLGQVQEGQKGGEAMPRDPEAHQTPGHRHG